MKTYLKTVIALTAALFLGTQSGNAEHPNTQVKVSIKLERPQAMQSPDINPGAGTSKRFNPKNWMYLEAKMNVQAAPNPPTGYIDHMTVRFYIAAKNPEGRNSLMMSKEIKYVNVPVGQETYVCVFMSPSSVRRLTGGEIIGATTFTLSGVEVVYKDKIVAFDSSKGRSGWWANPTPSLVATNSFPLLNKNETPFAAFWYDRYPEIAPLKDTLNEALAPLRPAAEDTTPEQPQRPATPGRTPANNGEAVEEGGEANGEEAAPRSRRSRRNNQGAPPSVEEVPANI